MQRALMIEVRGMDEHALRCRIQATGVDCRWRLESRGGRWLLWLEASADSARLCVGLLAGAGVRCLDFAEL